MSGSLIAVASLLAAVAGCGQPSSQPADAGPPDAEPVPPRYIEVNVVQAGAGRAGLLAEIWSSRHWVSHPRPAAVGDCVGRALGDYLGPGSDAPRKLQISVGDITWPLFHQYEDSGRMVPGIGMPWPDEILPGTAVTLHYGELSWTRTMPVAPVIVAPRQQDEVNWLSPLRVRWEPRGAPTVSARLYFDTSSSPHIGAYQECWSEDNGALVMPLASDVDQEAKDWLASLEDLTSALELRNEAYDEDLIDEADGSTTEVRLFVGNIVFQPIDSTVARP